MINYFSTSVVDSGGFILFVLLSLSLFTPRNAAPKATAGKGSVIDVGGKKKEYHLEFQQLIVAPFSLLSSFDM